MKDFVTQAKEFTNINSTYTLNDGNRIPCVGFGTWKIRENENGEQIILDAINSGFRHFDSAALYKSETSIGKTIKKSGVPRDQIFITTKVWKDDLCPEKARLSLENSLRDLQTDYVDLLLIHWPKASKKDNKWQDKLASTWNEFIKMRSEGIVKSIGVANFLPHHFAALQSDILPCINQIEFLPGYLQEEAYEYSVKHNILIEAWRPLGQGGLIDNDKLKDIAAHHNKTTAQILLRYSLQRGVLPLPKTTHIDRMLENQKLFDFTLCEEEMSELNNLPLCAWSGEHPDTAIPWDD